MHPTIPCPWQNSGDMLGTSRKYVLLILDHLDQQKITKLQGDVRVLLK